VNFALYRHAAGARTHTPTLRKSAKYKTEEPLTPLLRRFLVLVIDQLVRRVISVDALRSSFSGCITTPSNGVAATKRPCTTLMLRSG